MRKCQIQLLRVFNNFILKNNYKIRIDISINTYICLVILN
jgi:hypothetical protein